MKSIQTNKIFMVLSIIAFLGFGAFAFADWGLEYAGEEIGIGGQGNTTQLSENEIRKLDQDRIDPTIKMRKISPNAARSFNEIGTLDSGMMNSGADCNW